MKLNILFLFLFFSIQLFAGEKEVLINGQENGFQSIAQFASFYKDNSNSIGFDEVIDNQVDFQPLNTSNPNFDFTASSYWIRFSLTNNSHHREYFIETARPLTNVADLHYINTQGKLQILRNGDDRPFDVREIKHRKVVFHVELSKDHPTLFYLHLKSDGEVLTAPIKVWTPEAFESQDYKEQFIMGAYYGLLLFVIIIYFFFYAALKEKSFLWYVLYVISLVFFQFSIDGFSFQYLFPTSTWLGNHAILFSAGITVAFVLKYAKEFLVLKDNLPRFNTTFNVFIITTLGITFLSLIDGPSYPFAFPIINGVSLISTLFILVTIIQAMRKKLKVSKLFFTAFFFLIIGAAIFILGNFNIIEPSFFTEQGIKLGSAFEVTFLSLTMANKFREIQQEKEKAQAELITQMDQINERLEVQVKERTSEINKQKEILSEQNEEILDSINYAQGIQQSILPPEEKIKEFLPKSFVLFRPKDIVSGDFYWMEHKDDITYFTAADCTGHGVPGGFVSMVGANGLNRAVNEYGLTTPAEILDKLTEHVENTFKARKDGMDISFCAIGPFVSSNDSEKTEPHRELQWTGAQNPMYIVSSNGINQITAFTEYKDYEVEGKQEKLFDFKPNKQPVGKFEHREPFANNKIKVQQGDRIYLLTDGFPDQFGGPKGKKFMSKKLKVLLLENNHLSMYEIHRLLEQTIIDWMNEGNSEQIDDICIFGVEV